MILPFNACYCGKSLNIEQSRRKMLGEFIRCTFCHRTLEIIKEVERGDGHIITVFREYAVPARLTRNEKGGMLTK